MKRYIKSSESLHIMDIISRVICFIVTDDVLHFNSSEIHASDDVSGSDDEYYATIPDDVLIATPKHELSHIDNVYVLDRIAKIDKSKLSPTQLRILKEEYRKVYKIDESDCTQLLDLFDKCNRVHLTPSVKNNGFLADYDLDDKDVLAVMHNLTIEDLVAKTRSINYNYLGNNLILAQPSVVISQEGESTMIGVKLYIKLDVDETTGDCMVLISFHPEDPTRPIQPLE